MEDKEELLELETRKNIYEFIADRPGTYLREIKKELDLPVGQVEYHLEKLEKHDLISYETSGNKKRYFIQDDVDYPDRKVISLLRQENPRTILLKLLEGEHTFRELLAAVDISKSTLSFHIKKLVKNDLVESRRDGRKKVYRCPRKERVAQVLITYESSFVDDAVDRFINTWAEMK